MCIFISGQVLSSRWRGQNRQTLRGYGHFLSSLRWYIHHRDLWWGMRHNTFAVFKHVLNPLKPADSEASPWTIVTGLVDQIDFTGVLRPDCDIRMSGECEVQFPVQEMYLTRTCDLGGQVLSRVHPAPGAADWRGLGQDHGGAVCAGGQGPSQPRGCIHQPAGASHRRGEDVVPEGRDEQEEVKQTLVLIGFSWIH